MMRNYLYYTLIILYFIIHTQILHAKDSYSLSRIDHRFGLSNSAVLSVFQDKNGFMWFGTYDGLNCFDGKDMQVYRSNPSDKNGLTNNIINDLDPAGNDEIWITTPSGLNRFSLKHRKNVRAYNQFTSFTNLYSNNEGVAWVTNKDSIYYYDNKCQEFHPIDSVKHKVESNFSFVDSQGIFWFFDNSLGGFVQYSLSVDSSGLPVGMHLDTKRVEIHNKEITYAFYNDGIMYFLDCNNDLYLYDVNRSDKTYIRNINSIINKYGTIKALEGIVSFCGDIIIAFRENGLIKLDVSQKYAECIIDRNIRIFTIYKDPIQNIVWIGTDGQGAAQYAKIWSLGTSIMLDRISDNLTRQVRSIFTDNYGDLWFGTKGDGLIRINKYQEKTNNSLLHKDISVYFPGQKMNISDYKRSFEEFQVFSITRSKYINGFWLGSADSSGVLYYSYDEDKVKAIHGNHKLIKRVHSFYEPNDSILWVATDFEGLLKVKIRKKQKEIYIDSVSQFNFYRNQKGIKEFFSMVPQGDSILWLGSRGMGLVKFNINTEEYFVYSFDKYGGNSANDILCIHQDENVLYLGTVSGLIRFEQVSERNAYSVDVLDNDDGLLNNMIHGILQDNRGVLWLSTNNGLVKYNPINRSFHSYYYTGGIQVGEFCDDAYYLCPYDGHLFFGGINGLIYLPIENREEDEYYPAVNFTNLSLGDKNVDFYDFYDEKSRKLTFNGASVTFSLSFVALDFIRGANFEYSYRLKHKDKVWSSFSTNNRVTFENLPYGEYELQIRYKKDVFYKDDTYYSLFIEILPPWYLSPAAYIIYVLLLIVVLIFCVIMIRKYLKRKYLISELIERERMSKIRDENTQEYHLKSSLTSISALCGMIKQEGNLTINAQNKIDSILNIITDNVLDLSSDGSNNNYLDTILQKNEVPINKTSERALPIILLLVESNTIANAIEFMLKEEYCIKRVYTLHDAFNDLKHCIPALFMVDTQIYNNKEAAFLEYLRNNKLLLTKTAFVPLLPHGTILDEENIVDQLADAYVIVPYGIIHLKSIVNRAIRYKENIKPMIVEGGENNVIYTTQEQAEFIQTMINVIDANLDNEELGSTLIAENMAMSPRKFYRKFKEISGDTSPSNFIKNYRLDRAALLLRTTNKSVQEIIVEIGISSNSYFYKEFTVKYGITPKGYRESVDN